MEQPKWEWMDTIFGAVLGVFSAVATMTGWTGRRFKEVDERHGQLQKDIDHKLSVLHGRVTPLMSDVAELRAYHEAKMQRLSMIEGNIKAIDEKQDEQIRILYRLEGRKRGGRDNE